MIGIFILRLVIWFLLTANFSIGNLIIGILLALLLPMPRIEGEPVREWLRAFWQILLTIPQAYREAIEMMIWPHVQEKHLVEDRGFHRSAGLVFLNIFMITFTPKTIVTRYHKRGSYEIHALERRKT